MNTEEKLEEAISILQNILLQSRIENEYDEEIYDFLKENDALPDDYKPYWL